MGTRHDDFRIEIMKRKHKQDMPVLLCNPLSARIRLNLEYILPMSKSLRGGRNDKMLIIENCSYASSSFATKGGIST